MIRTGDFALERARVQGHFTSSALLVDPQTQSVMLLMHPKVGRWLQFGGHIESVDTSFAAAASRECREESGYSDIELSSVPVAIDRHQVSCAGGVSTHWDVQYLATVDSSSHRSSAENLQTEWFRLGASAEETEAAVAGVTPELDVSVRRLIKAAWSQLFPHLGPGSMGTIHS